MSTTRVRIDPDNPATLPEGRFDAAAVDGTTEAELAKQKQEDDAEAMQDMARYARRVRRRLGSVKWSWHGVLTCRTRRSATGSKGSAARLAPHAPCYGCSTKCQRSPSACSPELATAKRQGARCQAQQGFGDVAPGTRAVVE